MLTIDPHPALDAGAFVTIFPQPLGTGPAPAWLFELLSLQNGLTFELTDEVEVPAGLYGQLRFVVDRAVVTLMEGYEFAAGGQVAELRVPSGSTSGIKVNLVNDLVLEEGEVTTITVDIPVDDNFRIQGNPGTPAGIQGVSFVPTLHEIHSDLAFSDSAGPGNQHANIHDRQEYSVPHSP